MTLKEIQFSKMHGLGNDYIVIDETKGEVIPESKKIRFHLNFVEEDFQLVQME